MGVDFQKRFGELKKKLEERDANQEHLEATLHGCITQLEEKLEE